MKNRMKYLLTVGLLAVILAGSIGSVNVQAADIAEIPASEVESVYNLGVDSNGIEGWARGPHIYSEAGIVMDMDSGAILYAKNIDDKHYPASITKVMTALVALQNYEMDERVLFTWDDIGFLEPGDAHIGIKPDEELSMEDCMFGMLLASANEVSHAIGAHMEGGFDEFLRVMNETAKEIGCTNSNWMNTHGLHDPEHYTSCRDMAIIGSEVFQYEKFREITGTHQHTIPVTNITNETRTFQQNHKMLREWDNRYYEYCVGGKTGYTDQALTTLVTFATKKDASNRDVNLVAVVMRTHGGGNNAYVDTRAMLNYAFENFSKVEINETIVADEHIADIKEGAYVMLPVGVSLTQLQVVKEEPTALEEKTGALKYSYGNMPVGEVAFEITDEYYNEIHGIKEEEPEEPAEKKEDKKEGPVFGTILKVLGIIVAVLVCAVIGRICYVSYKRKQRKKRRRQRRMQERNFYDGM